jgi:hypothetical protein
VLEFIVEFFLNVGEICGEVVNFLFVRFKLDFSVRFAEYSKSIEQGLTVVYIFVFQIKYTNKSL